MLTIFSPSASFDVNDEFFGNDKWRNAFKAFWREVAVRYKDQGPIVYDLVNEPWGDEARRRWTSYAKELTAAIREVDGRHTIMVEPPEWGWPNGFRYLEPTGDRNTVYSFHFYGPMDFTHQRNGGHMKTTEKQWRERVYPGFLQGEKWNKERFRKEVRTAAAWRDKYGVKIWCGEFGVARWARGALDWVRDWIERTGGGEDRLGLLRVPWLAADGSGNGPTEPTAYCARRDRLCRAFQKVFQEDGLRGIGRLAKKSSVCFPFPGLLNPGPPCPFPSTTMSLASTPALPIACLVPRSGCIDRTAEGSERRGYNPVCGRTENGVRMARTLPAWWRNPIQCS